jgi:flagellar basal body-associated protein FliL
MNIVRKKSRKPVIFIIATVIFLAIAAAAVHFAMSHDSLPKNADRQAASINYDPPTDDQVQAGINQKQSTVDNSAKNDSPPPAPTTSLNITMTSNGQSDGTYRIRYLIDQSISTGTCSLTMIKDGRTVVKTASVQALASSATCAGFDIPVAELGSGTWQATLTVSSGAASGTASNEVAVD